ncbi:MAG: histidine kinase [Rikenellaceae bacterium]|nr:histidine kinase [Rikenellaceae bacterium]
MNRPDDIISEIITSPRKKWLKHIFIQIFVALVTINILFEPSEVRGINNDRLLIWFIYFILVDILVYTNIYLLAKPLLLKKRFLTYVLSVTGLIAVLFIANGILQGVVSGNQSSDTGFTFLALFSSSATIGLLFAGFSALVIFSEWINTSKRRGELEKANMETELQMLKNQINPHFLFNTLNNCYLLVRKQRPEAAEIIFRLEDLLRYQIGDS